MWRASFLIMCRESVEIRRRDAAGLIKRSSQEKNRRNQRRFVRPRINTDRNNGVHDFTARTMTIHFVRKSNGGTLRRVLLHFIV
jgi:hypothetical protein